MSRVAAESRVARRQPLQPKISSMPYTQKNQSYPTDDPLIGSTFTENLPDLARLSCETERLTKMNKSSLEMFRVRMRVFLTEGFIFCPCVHFLDCHSPCALR